MRNTEGFHMICIVNRAAQIVWTLSFPFSGRICMDRFGGNLSEKQLEVPSTPEVTQVAPVLAHQFCSCPCPQRSRSCSEARGFVSGPQLFTTTESQAVLEYLSNLMNTLSTSHVRLNDFFFFLLIKLFGFRLCNELIIKQFHISHPAISGFIKTQHTTCCQHILGCVFSDMLFSCYLILDRCLVQYEYLTPLQIFNCIYKKIFWGFSEVQWNVP